jgi:hypothetical protein
MKWNTVTANLLKLLVLADRRRHPLFVICDGLAAIVANDLPVDTHGVVAVSVGPSLSPSGSPVSTERGLRISIFSGLRGL